MKESVDVRTHDSSQLCYAHFSGKMDSFLGNFKTRGSKGGGGTQSPPPRSSSATDSMATMATSLTSVGIKSSASGRVT